MCKINFILVFQHLKNKSTAELIDEVRNTTNIYMKCQIFGILLKREGMDFKINNNTIEKHLQDVYHDAGCKRHWAAVRYASSLLHHNVDSISPFITAVLVHGKQVCNLKNIINFRYFCQKKMAEVN